MEMSINVLDNIDNLSDKLTYLSYLKQIVI